MDHKFHFLHAFDDWLFHEGLSQLKEKLTEYKQPKKLKKLTSLFVSPRGERVAVAAGNYITILQKEDDYTVPCGIFTSKIYWMIITSNILSCIAYKCYK